MATAAALAAARVEEKLVLPSDDFFAAVKYNVVGSLRDQVRGHALPRTIFS